MAPLSVLCSLVLLSIAQLSIAQEASPATTAKVSQCVVALAEQADLPPQEIGVLREINAREGQQVDAGQLLLQLDDRKAQRELEVTQAKLAAAQAKANDDINIRYAAAAAAVAKAEYDLNLKANTDVPGSVAKVRINELYLKCKETELAIEKAKLDHRIAAEEAKVAGAEAKAAEVAVDRHKVYSPVDGVVVELRAHKGEAVSPSQAVIHVVRLDRLWVEGYVSASKFARAELENRPATVDVVITRGQKMSLPSKIIFAKPLTDTGDSYMVRAEVENRKVNGSWLLNPGMQADMSIQLGQATVDSGR